jgi:hypothetical protein
LNDNPAEHDVGRADSKYVPAPEFFKQSHNPPEKPILAVLQSV